MRIRFSYANFVSTLALALVLSGGAYAATQLPKNSVGAKQLKKNAVSSKKVKDGSLTAADLGAVSMGGDLTGTFPNPKVNVGALNGVVKGTRLTSVTALADNAGLQTLLTVPGIGPFQAECTEAGGARGLEVSFQNDSSSLLRLAYAQVSEDPAQNFIGGINTAPGFPFTTSFGLSPAGPEARYLRVTVVEGPAWVVELTALTSVSGGCRALTSAQTF
jgi:hypothetical protein